MIVDGSPSLVSMALLQEYLTVYPLPIDGTRQFQAVAVGNSTAVSVIAYDFGRTNAYGSGGIYLEAEWLCPKVARCLALVNAACFPKTVVPVLRL